MTERTIYDLDVYYRTSIYPITVQVVILEELQGGRAIVEALEGEPFEMSGMWGSWMRRQATVSMRDLRVHVLEQEKETKMAAIEVRNLNGKWINYNAAVNLMDDDLREEMHYAADWESEQSFFTAYELLHLERFGETWELSKSNPTW